MCVRCGVVRFGVCRGESGGVRGGTGRRGNGFGLARVFSSLSKVD
jgi:hypothetical protein